MPLLVPSAYTYTCVHMNEGSVIEKPVPVYAEKFGISRVNFELRKSRKYIHVLSRSQTWYWRAILVGLTDNIHLPYKHACLFNQYSFKSALNLIY